MAALMDAAKHDVTVLDIAPASLRRLPPSFSGKALMGDGTDEETLRRAGVDQAEAFIALTQSDNRNIMAAQIAKYIFHVPRVICRVYDPLRTDVYEALGLEAISPTSVFSEIIKTRLEDDGKGK